MKKSLIKGFVFPLLLLALWNILAASGVWSADLLPSPGAIFCSALELFQSGVLLKHLLISLARVIGGFLLACLTALPLAVWVGSKPDLSPWFSPIFRFFHHAPPLIFFPILLLWLGISETAILFMVVIASFFPIFFNSKNGIRNTDYRLIEVGKSLGLSKQKILTKIALPGAFPAIARGMRIGMNYSWCILIGAEMLAPSSGLGSLIFDTSQPARSDAIIVGVLTIAILGTLIDLLFQRASQDWLPWSQEAIYDERN
jgi:ABC-type nitrate/sulfonate/bicarbonate transport system, permease component